MDGAAFFEFEDILQARREQYDIAFSCKPYLVKSSVENGSATEKQPKPGDIKARVLSSAALDHAIRAVRVETGESDDGLRKRAVEIINMMAHDQNLFWARITAATLSYVVKQLYTGIHVNFAGLEKIRELFAKGPVVFLPSHRSYMDFLLLSFILYCYDMPIPVIAAAIDFLGMKFIGELLRKCGAFFIKRSFRADPLYWTIFSEYVQAHLHYAKFPVEFFIEGTRSRSGNFLYPKTGMMNVICQDYFKGRVKDIYFVPVSISYERILEEKLYAYELATGMAKPKESTSGLFKAVKVLDESFGNIYVYFGDSFSLREMSKNRVDRSVFSLRPIFEEFTSAESDAFVHRLSLYAIEQLQKNVYVQPWHLVASGLLNRAAPTVNRCIGSQDLLDYVNLLSELLRVTFTKQLLTQYTSTDVLNAIQCHPNTVSYCSFTRQFLLTADDMSDPAITPVQLLIYQNMFINHLAHLAFVIHLLNSRDRPLDQLQAAWSEVIQLFMYEFVSVNTSLDETLTQLYSLDTIFCDSNGVYSLNRSSPFVVVLSELLWPYLLAFACSISEVCRQIELLDSPKRTSYFIATIKTTLKRAYDAADETGPQCVSTSMINNALFSFKNLRVLKDAGKSQLNIDPDRAFQVRYQFSQFFRLPSFVNNLSSHL